MSTEPNTYICDPGVKTLGEAPKAPFSVCNTSLKPSWAAKQMYHSFLVWYYTNRGNLCAKQLSSALKGGKKQPGLDSLQTAMQSYEPSCIHVDERETRITALMSFDMQPCSQKLTPGGQRGKGWGAGVRLPPWNNKTHTKKTTLRRQAVRTSDCARPAPATSSSYIGAPPPFQRCRFTHEVNFTADHNVEACSCLRQLRR